MFLSDEDVASSRELALAAFVDLAAADEMEESNGEDQTHRYGIKAIANPFQFNLTVAYLAVGVTFRQIVSIITATKERTGLASIGCVNEASVCRYARFICALCLQKIAEMLMAPNVWAFSIALDMYTQQRVSYLDIRIRLCWQGTILNLHLVSVPVFERHNSENMFNISVMFLDCICREWRKTLVGVATDGARSMIGRIQGFMSDIKLIRWMIVFIALISVSIGLATRFEQVALPGLIRILCGCHQLYLLMQEFFKALLGTSSFI
ncbi:hypothetical protein PsorP6_016785 [Peronosclerospora sorghi]|uniref:Uncharacterized protein n=1 Tax=Peronosclerospora sorghi TaxID=230839 RepID=A0ACC0WDV8_9STRA|nr:hypothetical protein PsorP6_016785 [Peronosclerospora sorghi]